MESHRTGRRFVCGLLPMWISIGAMDVSVLAFGSQLSETAIVASVMDLYPIAMALGLAYSTKSAAEFFGGPKAAASHRFESARVALLVLAASAAFSMMHMSQHGSGTKHSSSSVLMGIGLGLIGAVLVALSVVPSIIYARHVHYSLTGTWPQPLGLPRTASSSDFKDHFAVYAWLSVAALAPLRVISGSVMAFVSAVLPAGNPAISLYGAGIAVLLGLLTAGSSYLFRWANGRPHSAAPNKVALLAPIASMGWLLLLGVSLPRVWLFVLAVSVLVSVNIVGQLRPEVFGLPARQ